MTDSKLPLDEKMREVARDAAAEIDQLFRQKHTLRDVEMAVQSAIRAALREQTEAQCGKCRAPLVQVPSACAYPEACTYLPPTEAQPVAITNPDTGRGVSNSVDALIAQRDRFDEGFAAGLAEAGKACAEMRRQAKHEDRNHYDACAAAIRQLSPSPGSVVVPAEPTERTGIALNVKHPKCHEAADAFWRHWKENGETHKHGYYESTWGAINRAIQTVGVVPHDYETPKAMLAEREVK